MARLYCKIILFCILATIVLLECSTKVESRICWYAKSRTHLYRYVRKYAARRRVSYYSCGTWSSRTCSRYYWEYYYYTAKIYSPYYTYYKALVCCYGYRDPKPSDNTLTCVPICSRGCNGGTCIRPNTCTCLSGWTGASCSIDINECKVNNGGCDHQCINNNGSYTCSCNSSFLLSHDNRTCSDINECIGVARNHCEHDCVNTHGGYHCDCHNGYKLSSNGQNCSDINECDTGNGGCQYSCINTNGSYYCECPSGHVLNSDKRTCSDINECLVNNGGCHQTCLNTAGSYYCQCHEGYTLGENQNSCIANSCPSIRAPSGGSMTCSGQQVTNENCTFNCNLGYQLNGSELRHCLPNGTWSGTVATCDILSCPFPMASQNSSVIYPCDNSYQGNCSIICLPGYHISQSNNKWEQSCVLTGNETAVTWTGTEKCTKKNPCDSNPCSPGQCIDKGDNTITCNCTGSYHMGTRCHIGYMLSKPFPILRVGDSTTLYLYSNPLRQIHLLINASKGLGLRASYSYTLRPNAGNLEFLMTPIESGVFNISYRIVSSGYRYITPDYSIVLVLPRKQKRNSISYFKHYGLDDGHLGMGCCTRTYSLPFGACPASDVTLYSSCLWNSEMNTNGVVFINIGSYFLPMSVAGYNIMKKSIYYKDSGMCSSCSSLNTKCYSSHDLTFSTNIIDELISHDSLLKTFFNKTRTLYPSWLTVEVNSTNETTTEYSSFDFMASFGSLKDTSDLVGCNGLSLPANGNQYVYAIRTSSNLLLTINSTLINLNSLSSSRPFCVLFDACTTRTSSVYATIPSDLQSYLLSQVPSLNRFISDGGNSQLQFYNITMKDGGIPISLNSVYWNGASFIKMDTTNYDYDLYVSLIKSFTGNHLNVNMSFIGSVLYNTKISHGQVPGVIVGRGSVNIATLINTNLFEIQFSFKDPMIFNFPGTIATGVSSLPLGLAFYTTKFQSTCSSSSSICIANNNNDTSCLSYSFLQLDESFNAVSLSITSTCIQVYLYDLKLTYGLNHTITLFGNTEMTNSMSIQSRLTLPYLELGQFLKLQSSSSHQNSIISVNFNPTSNIINGIITDVNVSIFDAHFTTNLSIINDVLQFKKNTTVFGYDMLITSTSSLRYNSTTSNIPLSIQAVFSLQERECFLTIFNNFFQLEVKDLMSRHRHIENAVNEANDWYNYISNQTIQKQTELSQAQQEFNEAMIKYNNTKMEFENSIDTLIDTLQTEFETNSTTYDDLDLDDICNRNLCESGLQCTSCNYLYHLNITYGCVTVNEKVSPHYRYVPTTQWNINNKCFDTFKIKWSSSYYVLKYQQCITDQVLASHYMMYRDENQYARNMSSCNNETNFTDSVSASNICCHPQDCLYATPDSSCVNSYQEILQNISTKYNTSYLSSFYRELSSKLRLLEESRNELFEKGVKLNHTKEQYDILRTLYISSVNSLQYSKEANQSLYEETTFFRPFIDIQDLSTTTEQEYVKIHNITFEVQLHDKDIPTNIPLIVEIELLHTRKKYTVNLAVNFLNRKDLLSNRIALSVLETIVSEIRNVTYTSIQTPERCYIEKPMKLYLKQLIESLQLASSNLNTTRMKSVQLIQQLSLPYNKILADYQKQTLSLIDNFSLPLWQIGMETLHVNLSQFEPFGCSSFTECLVAVSITADYILGEDNGVILNQLKYDIPQISYNKSLTFQKAISTLQKLVTLLNTFQFCDKAPIVRITYNKDTLNILRNRNFSLSCVTNSTTINRSIQFYWTRNNILLPNSNSSTYSVHNADITDSGYYQCIGYNDRGSDTSNSVLVQVYSVPTLSTILPPVMNINERVDTVVNLVCETDTLPSPSWKWFYSQTGNSLLEISGAYSNVYTIENPSSSNEGWYQCLAYNVITNATCKPLHLHVLPSFVARMSYQMILNFHLKQTGDFHDSDISNSLRRYFQERLNSQSNNTILNNTISKSKLGADILTFSVHLTTPFISNSSLSIISAQLNSALQQLEQDKRKLVTHFPEGQSYYFNIQNYLVPFTVNTFQVNSRSFVCPFGYELHLDRAFCVACKPGQYSSNNTLSIISTEEEEEYVPQCTSCPLGSYQENHGSSNCLQCSDGYSTLQTGSTQASDCKELCPPNSHSSSGFSPCSPCPSLHYQPHSGQTVCFQANPPNTLSSVSTAVQTVTQSSDHFNQSTATISKPLTTISANPQAASVNNVAVVTPIVIIVIILVLISIAVVVIIAIINMRNKKRNNNSQEEENDSTDLNNINPCYAPRPPNILDTLVVTNHFTQQENTIKKIGGSFESFNFESPFEKKMELEESCFSDDNPDDHIYETLSTYSGNKEDEDYI